MVALTATLLVLAGCSRPAPAGAGAAGTGGPGGPPPAMPVSVITVSPQRVPAQLEAVGTLEGWREVEVRARVGGIVEQQLYREGEVVKAGAPLFQIDHAGFDLAADAARAAIALAEVRLEQARRENTRLAALVAERAISQREADTALTDAKTAEAQLAAARVQLRDAELNRGYTRINAPIGGLAQRALRSVGSLVTAGNDTALLTTIVQTHPIRARFALGEADAARLRAAPAGAVRLLDREGRVLAEGARLDFAGSVIDPRLGTVPMRAEVANPKGTLLPGQTVRVQVATGEVREAYLVPQAALASDDQGRIAWVVQDGKAAPKRVRTGGWAGSDWIIESGLAPGDQVIVDNLMKLRPGAPVQVAAPAAAAPASAPASGAVPAASAASPAR